MISDETICQVSNSSHESGPMFYRIRYNPPIIPARVRVIYIFYIFVEHVTAKIINSQLGKSG